MDDGGLTGLQQAGIYAAIFASAVAIGLSIETRVRQARADRRQKKLEAKVHGLNPASATAAPPMPKSMVGYRPYGDPWDGTVRIHGSSSYAVVDDISLTMNGCAHAMYSIRWRTLHGTVIAIQRGGYNIDRPMGTGIPVEVERLDVDTLASSGLFIGTQCEQPVFRLAVSNPDEEHRLVDVAFEVQYWRAVP